MEHVQPFETVMQQICRIFDVFATSAKVVVTAVVNVVGSIFKAVLSPRKPRYSPQSRHYLSVKRRAVLRMQRYGRN